MLRPRSALSGSRVIAILFVAEILFLERHSATNRAPARSFMIPYIQKQLLAARIRRRELWSGRRADGVPLLVIALFFILFFWPALFGGRFLLAGDPLLYSYPLRTVAWEMIRQGSLPLWTPLIFSGYPLFSMAQLGVAYPLTWGYLFLPGHWAEQVYILAPYLLSPIFVYAYGREVRLSRMASLLAGLSFGYGGLMISLIGLNGMLPNAVMWLPLCLIAIERARTRRFAPCLLLATASYSMSVLTGIGQGFVYAGCLMAFYAAFITAFWPQFSGLDGALTPGWLRWERWRPLLVALGAIVLSAGVSAFQVGETLRASEQSVRARLNYEVFTYGSFPFRMVWKSLLEPLHNAGDATSYAPLLAFSLAVLAAVKTLSQKPRDRRVVFWLVVTVAACVLMMGMYTPLGRALFHIPVINRFRIPSRHSFEWTFGLSILSAYGWDALKLRLEKRKPAAIASRQTARISLALICLALGAGVGVIWWRSMGKFSAGPPLSFNELHASYLGWKAALFLLTLIAAWQSFRITARGWRMGLLAGTIMLACFVEPYIQLSHLAIPVSSNAERFSTVAPTTRFLRQYPAEQNRVYTQINLSAEAHSPNPLVDPPNLTALAGWHNVAGYEPLMLERYSRALNSSQWETVNRGVGLMSDQTLFEPQSHVLDLLNTGFVVSYSNLRAEPETFVEKDGIKFAARETSMEVESERPLTLSNEASGGSAEGDTLALVTTLANAAGIDDGAPVARIKVHTAEGMIIERSLRAGLESSEWAHERADVRPIVRHALAPVFDTRPGDADNNFSSYRYLARINLGLRHRVARIELVKLLPQISVVLWKASLYDSSTSHSALLSKSDSPNTLSTLDPERWEIVYKKDGALILRNRRALPRAWLVREVEAVTEVEGWRRIRGLSDRTFDPRRTALLEVEPDSLPALSGRPLSDSAAARVVSYEPNRLVIETDSDHSAILVVSELYYPGWIAKVDGVETPIYRTNFLLRGIATPAGRRRIEMIYTAPRARAGAVFSLFALLCVGGLAIHAVAFKKRNSATNEHG